MDTGNYIETGVLELYVYGLLSEDENAEISKLVKTNADVAEEIAAIENAIITVTSAYAPPVSAENLLKVRQRLAEENNVSVAEKRPRNWSAIVAWSIVLLLLLGIGYMYTQLEDSKWNSDTVSNEKDALQRAVAQLSEDKKQAQLALSVVRDTANTVIPLVGQEAAPTATATMYHHRQDLTLHLDAAGLPTPPEGMVYQVWSLRLDPMTPTNLGIIDNFGSDPYKLFPLGSAVEAEAFAVTLEPSGGSLTPTLEQLIVLGKR